MFEWRHRVEWVELEGSSRSHMILLGLALWIWLLPTWCNLVELCHMHDACLGPKKWQCLDFCLISSCVKIAVPFQRTGVLSKLIFPKSFGEFQEGQVHLQYRITWPRKLLDIFRSNQKPNIILTAFNYLFFLYFHSPWLMTCYSSYTNEFSLGRFSDP